MDEFDDEFFSTNSELRYLTLELMKIAVRKNKSFEEVAREFIKNVYYLQQLIEREPKPIKQDEKR